MFDKLKNAASGKKFINLVAVLLLVAAVVVV